MRNSFDLLIKSTIYELKVGGMKMFNHLTGVRSSNSPLVPVECICGVTLLIASFEELIVVR